jgi:tetratricopeptide (TPR) repeat protein
MNAQPLASLCGLALLCAIAGCATLNAPVKEAQERRQRNQALARDVAERRDAADLLAARERYERGELDEARKTLVRLLARSPEHAEAKQLLAIVERTQKAARQPQVVTADARAARSENTVRTAWDGDSDDADAGADAALRATLGPAETALRQRSVEPAVARIRRAWAANPQDPQIPISGAGLLLRYHQPEAAVSLLREAAERFPNTPGIHRMLGVGYYRLGDYPASQVALRQALSLDKSSALSYFLMGCTLAKSGQPEAAAAHFRQAQLRDPRYGVQR